VDDMDAQDDYDGEASVLLFFARRLTQSRHGRRRRHGHGRLQGPRKAGAQGL
jgi:hypothetical protein